MNTTGKPLPIFITAMIMATIIYFIFFNNIIFFTVALAIATALLFLNKLIISKQSKDNSNTK